MVDERALFPLFIALTFGLFGLLVGSFANVVIYRLPLERSIVFPASSCPHCHAAIKPWQNIPVFSWLALRGRCASCGAPISMRYPIVEALHGVGFLSIFLMFGLSFFTPFLLLLFFSLVVLAFIDWDHQILPDRITLPMTAIGLLSTVVPGALIGWKESALAALFGYGTFFLVAEGYSRLRGVEGLGMGDWKLAAMMGAFLGGRRLLLTVFLASVSGMIYGLIQATRERAAAVESEAAPESASEPVSPPPESGERGEALPPGDGERAIDPAEPVSFGKYRLPFGTFLAASAIFVLFRGDALLNWYASLFAF